MAYAKAERRGQVTRQKNIHGMSAEVYAAALYKDGITRGWIREPATSSGEL